jgi:hypothetical protein
LGETKIKFRHQKHSDQKFFYYDAYSHINVLKAVGTLSQHHVLDQSDYHPGLDKNDMDRSCCGNCHPNSIRIDELSQRQDLIAAAKDLE